MLWERIYSSPKYHKERNGSNSMITKQTNADYSKLFEKASIALGAKSEDEYITSLNEYFMNIADLVAMDNGLQYTILPLDEETFDIDANTREITVPKSFKDGVGVQGDQVAEIIYFTIDRYFDATDLNTQNIYIEWRNANGDEGLSKEYVRDLTTLSDKIIFGWPLTSEITDSYGTIEFAVRFYTVKDEGDQKEIIYSFATKPQRITINKTMDFEITDDSIPVYDATEMIINRFQNSEPTDSETTVDAPIFLLDLIAGDNYNISDNDGHDLLIETYALKAQAYGTGRVTYYLESSEPDKNEWTSTYEEPYYELTKDTTPAANKTYYTAIVDTAGAITGYQVYEGELPTSNNTTVYEKFGLYFVNDAGKYRVRAQNRVGANYANALSKTVIFPAPIAPTVNTETASVILEAQGDGTNTAILTAPVVGELPTGAISYQWSNANGSLDGSGSTYGVTDAEGFYYVVVTNTRNNRSKSSNKATFRVTYPASAPSIINNLPQYSSVGETLRIGIDTTKTYDDVSVKWYEVAVPANGIDQNADRLCDTGNVDGTGYAAYTPDEVGVFYAVLTTVYNNDRSESINSALCSVT